MEDDKQYVIRVLAKNAIGESFPLISDIITPIKSLTPPSAPGGLRIVSSTGSTSTLQWRPPKYEGSSPISKYVIMKKETKTTVWEKAAEVDKTANRYAVSNLDEEKSYDFAVYAVNEVGDGKRASTEFLGQPTLKMRSFSGVEKVDLSRDRSRENIGFAGSRQRRSYSGIERKDLPSEKERSYSIVEKDVLFGGKGDIYTGVYASYKTMKVVRGLYCDLHSNRKNITLLCAIYRRKASNWKAKKISN